MRYIAIMMLAVLVAGCDIRPNNARARENVRVYSQTGEISSIPGGHTHQFVVRKTDGSVWVIESFRDPKPPYPNKPYIASEVQIFPPNK